MSMLVLWFPVLKGMETRTRLFYRSHLSLCDVRSRLKGIETPNHALRARRGSSSCDAVSRLKGMETSF